ncbi:MAG: tripartite tricarboxylate transporter substrate binding protein, partial [Burkholderiaceae bacterium]|nr:tripartite tricarboxylate transporter substrate binding protein [Burkholderiaceae bacterium]
ITAAQRDALIAAVRTATESAAWKDTLARLGWDAWFLAGDDFKKFLDDDVKRIGAIIDSLGLKK